MRRTIAAIAALTVASATYAKGTYSYLFVAASRQAAQLELCQELSESFRIRMAFVNNIARSKLEMDSAIADFERDVTTYKKLLGKESSDCAAAKQRAPELIRELERGKAIKVE